MKKILFIAILAIISSAPAYAAVGGHGASQGGGQGAGHGAGHRAGHGTGGQNMYVIPSDVMSGNVATQHNRKKMQAAGYVETPKEAQARAEWEAIQSAAARRR